MSPNLSFRVTVMLQACPMPKKKPNFCFSKDQDV